MSEHKKFKTDFLVANSFAIGLGSIFNLPGDYFLYNYSETEAEADSIAIANDWHMVGQDIENAILKFKSEKQLVISFVD